MTMNRYGGVGIRTDKSSSYGFCVAGNSAALGAGNLTDSGGLILQPRDAFFATGRTYPAILWSGNTNNLERARAGITAVSMNSNDASSIIFMTRHAANGTALTTADERFRISDTGKISIGNGTSAYLNSDTDGDRTSLKVGNQLHISGGGNANFRQGIYNNCRGQGQANFYQGSIAASGGDYRASALTFAYGGVQVWNDDGNNTNYAANAQITTMSQNFDINNQGNVTAPNQVCFKVYGTGGNTNYSGDMIFTLNLINRRSCYNTSNGRFTAPVAGIYLFHFGYFPNSTSTCRIELRKNGSAQTNPYISGNNSSMGSGHPSISAGQILELSANDYVTIGVNGTLVNTYNGHTGFSGVLLS
jgi:hypothetical protein